MSISEVVKKVVSRCECANKHSDGICAVCYGSGFVIDDTIGGDGELLVGAIKQVVSEMAYMGDIQCR